MNIKKSLENLGMVGRENEKILLILPPNVCRQPEAWRQLKK